MRLGGKQAADIVLTPCEVDHSSVAQDETEREKRLGVGAIVVVAVASAVDAAGCTVARAAEGRALERDGSREPCLPGCTEGESRGRDAKHLW